MVKVTIVGAAGGIGQPLSLLLKANPLVTELALYDLVNTPGVAADLAHVNTPAKVIDLHHRRLATLVMNKCPLLSRMLIL